jgi:protein-S-isoprenylcysteine O-methyltransferase Ste14
MFLLIWIVKLIYGTPKESAPSPKVEKKNSDKKADIVVAQGTFTRALHLFTVGTSFIMVNVIGPYSFLPQLGYGLIALGLIFIVFARLTLGAQWRGRPEIRSDHKLITSGIYSVVRHPIYTGLVFMSFGTAMVAGSLLSYLMACVTTIAYWIKLKTEESILIAQFGKQYVEFKKSTRAIIPYIF